MSVEIDPYDLIAPRNYGEKGVPHDSWTTLRRESPVHRCEFGGEFQDFWAITKHADIMDISGKPELRKLIYERPVRPPEGYLDKPVDEKHLLTNVRKILELAHDDAPVAA